jgi:methyl-accepting chemotaxis protein
MLEGFFSKSSQKPIKNTNSDYIHKDVLIDIFSSVIQGKARKLSANELECNGVEEKWNEMISVICDDKRKTILEVNDILQIVTRMDAVKDMINSVNTQTESLHFMSSGSEQLSSSIEDVSNMSQKVLENSYRTKQVTGDGVKNISHSIEFVKKSFDEIDTTNKQMQIVKEKTHTINQIIYIVKGIAERYRFFCGEN